MYVWYREPDVISELSYKANGQTIVSRTSQKGISRLDRKERVAPEISNPAILRLP